MADLAIRTRALRKTFGDVHALNGLDLEVRTGEVLGFLGPNGAGKSTTIRILMDLLRPSSGAVSVLGVSPSAGGPALRARVGYLPGELHLTGTRTAGGILAHLARLRGGRGADRIPELARALQLDLERPVRGLSKGNKQKVGVVQAFMHQPELLVLDEPTSGLDPLLQQVFLDLVREARDGGATVLMSSHVLSEVEDCADRVAIIRDGRIVTVDDVTALRRRAGQAVELRFADPVNPAAFAALPGVTDVSMTDGRLRCIVHGEPDALLKVAAGHHVTWWQARDRDLEEEFMDIYRTAPPASRPTVAAVAGSEVTR
jgi:ABC-2 type transport system ATP-binding protein